MEKKSEVVAATSANMGSCFSVPPCDTDVFCGDYATWPTFRDLFSALYIKNSKLSDVERLFHLIQKTEGEARDIVRNAPLTNDGFRLAWVNLSDQYENKRMQINNQIKILLDLPSVEKESGSSVKRLQRTINNAISTLKMLGIATNTWDPILVFLCCSKLPKNSLQDFENTLEDNAICPSWMELDTFLTRKYKTLESISDMKNSNSRTCGEKKANNFHVNSTYRNNRTSQHDRRTDFGLCRICEENHSIRDCSKFLSMTIEEKQNTVKRLGCCFNCLSYSHMVKNCRSQFRCSSCNARHNTLLHTDIPSTRDSDSANVVSSTSAQAAQGQVFASQVQSISSNLHNFQPNTVSNQNFQPVLFCTANVNIVHNGERFLARALIDSGSDYTLLTEKLIKRLRIRTHSVSVNLNGINQALTAKTTKACNIVLSSPINADFQVDVHALVVRSIAENLPTQPVDRKIIEKLPNIKLADPQFYNSRPVDIIIGNDLRNFIFRDGIVRNIGGCIMAQETTFGWILSGKVHEIGNVVDATCFFNIATLETALTRFWEMEDIPKCKISGADEYCERNYHETVKRIDDGRYVVTLPFRNQGGTQLGKSRHIAMAQFLRGERSLMRKPETHMEYNRVLMEYLKLGHMKEIDYQSDEMTGEYYYLPHHAVIKPEKVSSKLRVVFNGSCPTSNGKSLNDVLYPGPALQLELPLLISRWRFFRYVYNADITQMYRQIRLNPTQTKFQRILYRQSDKEPIRDYELQTVTFGINSAPFLAIRTLHQLAKDVLPLFPRAAFILQNHMYVDDVLTGEHDVNEAIRVRKELAETLGSAGFHLRKWAANDPRILEGICETHLLTSGLLDLNEATDWKTLGIHWDAKNDAFYFCLKHIDLKNDYTKREMLSTIARLFDPVGWLAPIVVGAKILMQQVWKDGTDWDKTLKATTLKDWTGFLQSMTTLKVIKIPRWNYYTPGCSVEFHGFADASQKAFAAVIYARVTQKHGTVFTTLLAAKTRVAPIKQQTLPRLELCGALLLADLANSLIPQLQVSDTKCYFWCDSQIVLAWLRKSPYHWHTYVANRVSSIMEKSSTNEWHYVCSHDNPADLASRSCSTDALKDNKLWWYGPDWLKLAKELWPSFSETKDTDEEKRVVQTFLCTTTNDPLEQFSTLSRALRVLCYVFRFYRNTRINLQNRERNTSIELTGSEFKSVRIRVIHLTQKMWFTEDYHLLLSNKCLPKRSNLLPFNPFIDDNNLIRANGRLVNSPTLSYNERHPIILPYQSHLSKLLVRFTHVITLHGETQLMIARLRSEFWIPKMRNLVQHTIRNCIKCTLNKKQLRTQIMASLPPERTVLSRPFTNTGTDFAGPFAIRNFSGRGCRITKGYMCVFICFSTKAVHLEAVSDLSTPAFLAAYSRFVSRRGCPTNMFSDNGTNFVGAKEMLKKDRLAFMKSFRERVISQQHHQHLEWHFIPPGAPHMGGLWEAAVKSAKSHLKKISAGHKFTFEEFATLLARVEACMNSRPLCAKSGDPSDFTILTPGHFLIGSAILNPSEPDVTNSSLSFVNRWQKLKILHQIFANRWKEEYLKELLKRYKWQYPQQDVSIGDMVVIRHENVPPNEWPLGRIVNVFKGPDSRVRVADIKTTNGTVTRAINKIVVLPVN